MARNNDVFEFRDLDADELADLAKIYSGLHVEFFRIGPKGYCVPKEYKKLASDIYHMPLKPSDVFVTSFQRSGTTWTQELVWLIANDLDYEKAAAAPLTQRYSFLELAMYFDEASKQLALKLSNDLNQTHAFMDYLSIPVAKTLADISSPCFVKTHLPMSLLPPKLVDTAKVVYVARDPRDVIVSSFHFGKLFKMPKEFANFRLIWNAFRKNLYTFTPYFNHLKEAWALRHQPNMLFLFYEDLLKDLPGSIRRVAKFLDKQLTPEQIERLCDHLSFENFKNNKSVNYEDMRDTGFLDANETFVRKGESGGWRNYFDEDMTREADLWIAENLRDSDLRFSSMGNIIL